jgi:hypothetical protein
MNMEKEDFLKILCTNTPEEINEFISLKGKKKTVNGVTFITNDQEDTSSEKES